MKASFSEINTILFDLGNVIYRLDISLAESKIQSLLKPGISRDQVLEVIKKFEVGEYSKTLFINGLLRLCPYTVQARDVIKAWNSMLIELPGIHIELLKKLKAKYHTFLLSNNNELHYAHMENYLSRQYNLHNFNEFCFHNTFYSHQINYRKPNQEAFKYVITETQLNPENTLFIDDSYDNIASAQALGFQTILFHPGADFIGLANQLLE